MTSVEGGMRARTDRARLATRATAVVRKFVVEEGCEEEVLERGDREGFCRRS